MLDREERIIYFILRIVINLTLASNPNGEEQDPIKIHKNLFRDGL